MRRRKSIGITCLGAVLSMVNFALAKPQNAPAVQIAAPPYDPFELVASPPENVVNPEARAAVLKLLQEGFSAKLQVRPPMTVKVSFTAGGEVQEVGQGEMDETDASPNRRHWVGRIGGFSITRIITDQAYDSVPPGPIPIRLEMARSDVLGPGMPSTMSAKIRTAPASLDGVLVTCILISVHGSEAPNRDWPEAEYCVEARPAVPIDQRKLLRVYSPAPGMYVLYDYANSSEPGGRPSINQVRVAEAGKIVLQGSVSVNTATTEELNPALFTATNQMFTGGVGLVGPSYQIQSRGGVSSGPIHPVVIHATLTPEGRVIEAESLQTSDPALSQSALDLVKKSKYETTFNYGYPPQQEIFITVQ